MLFDLFKKEEPTLNIQDILGFDIKNCAHVSPQEQKEIFIIRQEHQSDLHLSRYFQVDIKSGIANSKDLTVYFENSVRQAKKFFHDEPILFLPPHLYKDIVDNEHVFTVPRVFSCAILDRPQLLTNETNLDLNMTSISVAWWQDSFGKIDKNVIEQLFNLQWERPYAWSWFNPNL